MESGHYLDQLLDCSSSLLTLVDDDGVVSFASGSSQRVLGYDSGTLVGDHLSEYVHPDDQPLFRRMLADGSVMPVDTVEFRVRDAGGAWRWFEATATVLAEDATESVVVDLRDVTARKRAERQLETIFENTTDAVYVKSLDGRYEWMNEAGAALFGRDPTEVVGKTDDDIFDAGSAGKIATIDRHIVETGTTDRRETVRHIDGRRLVFVDEKFPQFNEDGEVSRIIGISRDVTERKQREHELERVKEEYQTVFENSQDALFLLSVDGDEVRFSRFNPTEEFVTGLSSEQVHGKTPVEAFGEELGGQMEVNYRRCLERRAPISYEEELDLPGGFRTWHTKLAPVVIDGEVTQIVGSASDISEEREHREQLEALHGATRRLIDAESREGLAEVVVDAAEQLLGYPWSSVWYVCDAGTDLVLSADSGHFVRGDGAEHEHPGGGWLWELFEGGETETVDDVPVDAFPANVPLGSAIVAPFGADGLVVCATEESRVFDATDVALVQILAQNVETALAGLDRQRELERQNERLDEFAGVISHDLRNPLSVASIRLELAREETDSEHLDRLDGALDRMEELIEDVLTLARQGRVIDEPKATDISAICYNAWENVETGHAELTVETNGTNPFVRADPSRVTELFENLFRNCIEHGGDGVSVRVDQFDGGFAVEDDGPGISRSAREHVFESGYTSSATGTGFGLAIVEAIAEAHGWECSVTAGEDGGARFEFSGVESVRQP
ncbi:sensor histidine kinase [Haloarchaeobius amylolyticus]|uniref:sensor histidine kinase n=1 Tax=Haloarchaeobius amylolyticus TaxID=1198296 RepID=UPI00226E0A3C|nr:PAS domain-containing protein [Haloarchaeobius amylolyticus]